MNKSIIILIILVLFFGYTLYWLNYNWNTQSKLVGCSFIKEDETRFERCLDEIESRLEKTDKFNPYLKIFDYFEREDELEELTPELIEEITNSKFVGDRQELWIHSRVPQDFEIYFDNIWFGQYETSASQGFIAIDGYGEEKEKIKKYFTLEEIKDIKKKAKELFKQVVKANRKIADEYDKKLGVIQVDADEQCVTYRKDFASWEEGIGLLVTLDHPEQDEETTVKEIKDIDIEKFGNFAIETFVTDDKTIYEYIWEIKDETRKNVFEPSTAEKKLISSKTYYNRVGSRPFELIEKRKEQVSNLRKLFTNELYETETKFAYKEFKFFRSYAFKKKEEEYCLQHRRELEHEPYSNKINIQSHNIIGFINLFEKQIEWLNKINKNVVLASKINKVGENSRHIILDKSKGLNVFGGYNQFPPNEIKIKVKYENGRIIITERDYYEKDTGF